MADLQTADGTIKKRLHGLDHLRALAIILVFFFHYRLFGHPLWVKKIGFFGSTGVDLFFVLSGYLIASGLFDSIIIERKVLIKQFYLKRLLRTIPAYLVVVAIYFLIPAFRETEALPPLWKFLTFTQNFGVDVKNFDTFSHAWSLCIEEQFYLFLPIIAFILFYFRAGKKSFVLFVGLLIITGIFFRVYNWMKFVSPNISTNDYLVSWSRYIYYPTYTRLDGLLAGVFIAGCFKFYPGIKKFLIEKGNILIIAGVFILCSTYLLYLHPFSIFFSLFSFPLIAIGYGLLLVSAISPQSILYKYDSKITRFIAKLSYSIYLTHKGFIHIAQQQFGKLGIASGSYLMLLLCIITCVAGAFILYQIVERPFLQLRNYLQKRI